MNTGTKLIAACLLIVLAAGPAYPRDREILQLQADLIRLTQQVKELQSSVDQNNAILKALENMADQVNNLADGLQRIRSSILPSYFCASPSPPNAYPNALRIDNCYVKYRVTIREISWHDIFFTHA